MAPLGVSSSLLTEDQGLVLSAILAPFDSNQFMLSWAMSFFQKLCPVLFPPVTFLAFFSFLLEAGITKNCTSVQFSSVAQSCPTLCDPVNYSKSSLLSITNFQISLKLMAIKSVMPSSHLILCRPLLLLPSIPPSIRVFSSGSTLHMRWPKY